MSRRSRRKKSEWVRTFDVSVHQSEGDDDVGRQQQYLLFDVTSVLYAAGFPEAATKITVIKRYNDLRKLHASLSAAHKALYLKGEFPILPKEDSGGGGWKKGLGIKKKPKITSPAEVETKRKACLQMLEFAASYPPLFDSQALVDFFSSSFDPKTQSPTSPASSSEPVSSQVAELQSQGNVMDASALALTLCEDKTPSLSPTPARMTPAMTPTPTTTTPDEEMTVLPDYLSWAAEDVSKAMQLELEERYDESVACYRDAIGTLLSSVQQDRCLKRQASVKRRIAQYIEKAESLVNKGTKAASKSPCKRTPHLDLFGDIDDLAKYKVIGVLSNKVLLARDFKANDTMVVIKVLQKSSAPTKSKKRSLLPISIPFMVKLRCYYETQDCLALVLEHIPGGPIYELLSNVFMIREEHVSDPPEVDQEMSRPSSLSVIKPSPSFLDIQSRDKSCDTGEDASHQHEVPALIVEAQERRQREGSVESSEDLSFVHKISDERLLCVDKEGIEKIQIDADEEDAEEDEFDFADDFPDEQAIEASEDNLVSASQRLLSSVNAKLLDGADNADRAAALLSHLDRLEARLNSRLDSRPRTPASPFRIKSQNVQSENNLRSLQLFSGYTFSASELPPASALKKWSSQLFRALFALHARGFVIGDLGPQNLLLDSRNGDLRLTYVCEWTSVERRNWEIGRSCDLYTAPEVASAVANGEEDALLPVSDFWSAGVILYELSTGRLLTDVHPSGLLMHTPLEFPTKVEDPDLASLVRDLLRPRPELRLGAGSCGTDDIRCHPYFRDVDWEDPV